MIVGYATKLEEFFFEAALEAWAGKGKKTTITELPRSKVFIHGNKLFHYVDSYFKAAGGTASLGQTVIWDKEKNIPIWWMQYHGAYPERMIPFLKTALCTAYENHEFWGGRGPLEFHQDGLTYINHLTKPSSFFDLFQGWEEIIEKNDGEVDSSGYHHYVGGLLKPDIELR